MAAPKRNPIAKSDSRIRRALLVANPKCGIEFANADARQWLRRFFQTAEPSGVLPRQICRWLAAQDGWRPFSVKDGETRLVVRRYWPHPRDAIALMLEQIETEAARSARTHNGLTVRENEVLGWIAAGKPDRDIAEILDRSPKTIGKHVERILVKLGVDNRTAAASIYSEAAH